MTLRLFTLVHGEPYMTWMQQALVPSLSWPINRNAIRNAEWHIYTTEQSRDRVIEIARPLGLTMKICEMNPDWAGQFLASAVRQIIMEASSEGDQILMAPPDTIFGEGTLETFVALGRDPRVVISAPPVRVNQSFMSSFAEAEGPVFNETLVYMAWKHLHATWRDANITMPRNNSFIGGVSWKALSANVFAVTHLLPTPFYLGVAPSDGEWFRLYGTPGAYDHIWPAKLVDEGRQRLIGSSDAAFIVEITEADKNIPPLYPVNPSMNTEYSGQNKHNHVNRNTVCIFRMP